ncbi:hypothetical protein JT27_03995 [Alcaligenes faecalis]|nr:hypothetical protein JT27_03995 [Alcaligenes faecalis]
MQRLRVLRRPLLLQLAAQDLDPVQRLLVTRIQSLLLCRRQATFGHGLALHARPPGGGLGTISLIGGKQMR